MAGAPSSAVSAFLVTDSASPSPRGRGEPVGAWPTALLTARFANGSCGLHNNDQGMRVLFPDRRDAGRRLAVKLMMLADQRPVVVALPRGGVPVAVEVARALRAPLDILAVRKLGAPGNPELGVGAVAEDGTAVLDMRSAGMLGITEAVLQATLARESRELCRQVRRYRDGHPAIPVSGRNLIVVDDGLATGLSDLAAVRVLRGRGALSIVVAAPVGSRESVSMLTEEAEDVVCLTVPRRLLSVGMWYRDFTAVGDDQVLALLADRSEQS
jgi:putative phosphoribosyl transferase